MKKFRFVLPLVILMSMLLGLFGKLSGQSYSVSNAQAAANLPYGQTGTNWVQTFGDEFDGTSLNRSIWQSDIPNGGNGELQEYVNDDSHNNYIVQNGALQIVARKEYYQGRNYTSGVILTQNAYRQKYGYFEMRARVPSGQGLWPAFWMLADPWVPEIDITEILSGAPDTTYMTLHYSGGQSMSHYTGPDFSASWHVFGVDWEPNALVWYVDGVERKRITDTSIIPNVSMWILANLAVGGNWGGNPDSTTVFPATMYIDYIRAWQKTAAAAPTATAVSPTSTKAPTTSAPTATTAPSSSLNMINNASFETTGASPWYSPWTVRNDLNASFTQDTATAANGSKASMKASLPSSDSSQPWVVAVTQLNKSLQAGQSYTLSFWAKASAQRPVHAVVQEENSPYTEYTNQVANLTGTWTKYTYTFTAPTTTASAMLNLNLAEAAGSVWIDEISLAPTGSSSNSGSTSPYPTATAQPTEGMPTPSATFQPSDTTPPGVSITSPVNGAQVNRKSAVTISATASDNSGIAKVEFRVNGTLICTDSAAPYTCTWTVPNSWRSSYTLEAKAYDLAQNTAISRVSVKSVK